MKRKWLLPLLFFLCLLGIWEGCVRLFQIPPFLLPGPLGIGKALITNLYVLVPHTLTTLKEALIGMVIAVVAAMVISTIMDLSKTLRAMIYPNLVMTQTVPVMVLAPLFSYWFGFGLLPKIIMVVFMCFFPIAIAFSQGYAEVEEKQIELFKSFQATKFQLYWKLKIPYALQHMFSGLRISATYCIGGAVVGEWISSSSGLGYYMLRAKNGYHLDEVFACIVVIVGLSLLFNYVVTLIEKYSFPYKRKVEKK